jgi:hypothetical protein
LPEPSFWLLAAEEVEGDTEQGLMAKLDEIRKNLGKYEGKLALLVGFLGPVLSC